MPWKRRCQKSWRWSFLTFQKVVAKQKSPITIGRISVCCECHKTYVTLVVLKGPLLCASKVWTQCMWSYQWFNGRWGWDHSNSETNQVKYKRFLPPSLIVCFTIHVLPQKTCRFTLCNQIFLFCFFLAFILISEKSN